MRQSVVSFFMTFYFLLCCLCLSDFTWLGGHGGELHAPSHPELESEGPLRQWYCAPETWESSTLPGLVKSERLFSFLTFLMPPCFLAFKAAFLFAFYVFFCDFFRFFTIFEKIYLSDEIKWANLYTITSLRMHANIQTNIIVC